MKKTLSLNITADNRHEALLIVRNVVAQASLGGLTPTTHNLKYVGGGVFNLHVIVSVPSPVHEGTFALNMALSPMVDDVKFI